METKKKKLTNNILAIYKDHSPKAMKEYGRIALSTAPFVY